MKKDLIVAALCAAGAAYATDLAGPAGEARCRKEVRDYLETLKFVRQAAGDGIGEKVARGYVDEAELQRLASRQGACAAAQLLKEKRAVR